MKIVVLCCLIALIAPSAAAQLRLLKKPVEHKSGLNATEIARIVKGGQVGKPNVEYCPLCVNFMGDVIQQLLDAILQAGVAGGCGGICSQLPNQAEQIVCELLCLYVGVDAFAAIVSYEDPDPIFICEELYFCTPVDGGQAKTLSAIVSPKTGRAGGTFTFTLNYQVIQATGPGYLSLFIIPPDGFPFGASEFTAGQTPNTYQISWNLQATPSEQEPFSPGRYIVDFAVCEGDCSTAHKWGGVYCNATTSFTITQ